MSAIVGQLGTRDSADIGLRLGCLLVCGLAVLLPLYYAFTGKDEGSSPVRSVPLPTPSVPIQFEMLYSENQRGLMLFDGYIYLLRQGDVLPDGSRFGNASSQTGESPVKEQERAGGDELS